MATRLPVPGSDEGQWGDILNDFLSVEHNSDGSLKASGSLGDKYTKPVSGIPKSDLSAAVQESLDNADAAVTGTAPDATATTKGMIRLSSDLTGTAMSPLIAPGVISDANIHTSANIAKSKLAPLGITDSDIASSAAIAQSKIQGLVTDLANKAAASHTHDAAAVTTGVLDPSRLGAGASISTKFLRGDSTWVTVSSGVSYGVMKLEQNTDQNLTEDMTPVLVNLQSISINAGGSDMHAGTNYIEIDQDGIYALTAMCNVTVAARGGDRNVCIFKTTGTPNPSADTDMLARFEITSNNSTTRDTGSWMATNTVNLVDGDRVYLVFVQHARTGTGTASITLGDSDGSPRPYLIVQRVG